MIRQTVICLTAVPPRFNLLQPTLHSLTKQSLQPREVRLYIPRYYRRFPDWDGSLPAVPAGVTIFRCSDDYGPATKILPALSSPDCTGVDILFCDDDHIYHPDWHASFKEEAVRRPEICIVEQGDSFPDISDRWRAAERLPRGRFKGKDLSYQYDRLRSFFGTMPNLNSSGFVDMVAGFAGVLVKPEWFDNEIYDIPDVMWTVDDPWISGHLERMSVPIWMMAKGNLLERNRSAKVSSLSDFIEFGHNRVASDLLVIDYFRARYGIWPRDALFDRSQKFRTATMAALARRRTFD
ncbi:glycosyltransferase family A protein [Brucella pituitosa]|uniref:glycosyltransferase family A protein n=1 Tax=Brucella pituitosa TaxID=571256 RepID=UPI0009A14E16